LAVVVSKGYPRWMKADPEAEAIVRKLPAALLADALRGECVVAADDADHEAKRSTCVARGHGAGRTIRYPAASELTSESEQPISI